MVSGLFFSKNFVKILIFRFTMFIFVFFKTKIFSENFFFLYLLFFFLTIFFFTRNFFFFFFEKKFLHLFLSFSRQCVFRLIRRLFPTGFKYCTGMNNSIKFEFHFFINVISDVNNLVNKISAY